MERSAGQPAIPVPLLRGDGASSCSHGPVVRFDEGAIACEPGQAFYDVVAQIPFELDTNSLSRTPCTTPPCVRQVADAVLTIREGEKEGTKFRVYPVDDNIRVLDTCRDRVFVERLGFREDYSQVPCYSAITHGDGTWVSLESPARPGELLTAYAFGLGKPDAAFPTLAGTPQAGVRVSRPIQIHYAGISQPTTQPSYVGLVGGNAGLYQINFHAPQPGDSLPRCTAETVANVSMLVRGTASADHASFCLAR